jgi:hypothetical protein
MKGARRRPRALPHARAPHALPPRTLSPQATGAGAGATTSLSRNAALPSFRMGMSGSASLRQSNPAQHLGESRVRMQAVKERIVLDKNTASGALLDTAIQPMESLVLVS